MRCSHLAVSQLLLLVALGASDPGSVAADSDRPSASAVLPAGTDGPVEVRMEEVEIKGEVERPGVFYIIPRREAEMDLGSQTRDYTQELSQPLDAAAFERWVRQRRAQP